MSDHRDDCYDFMMYIDNYSNEAEFNMKLNRFEYVHMDLRVPISFCPFCGKSLIEKREGDPR